jgi:hypothetical protein
MYDTVFVSVVVNVLKHYIWTWIHTCSDKAVITPVVYVTTVLKWFPVLLSTCCCWNLLYESTAMDWQNQVQVIKSWYQSVTNYLNGYWCNSLYNFLNTYSIVLTLIKLKGGYKDLIVLLLFVFVSLCLKYILGYNLSAYFTQIIRNESVISEDIFP